MKRIVDGVTYNTDTATRLARANYETERELDTEAILYQTRGGAYFVHRMVAKERWIEREQRYEGYTSHSFEPMSSERAHAWLMEGEVEIFHNPFEDPPEAAVEAEPGATLYVRLPTSLKNRIDEAARIDGVSANVWAMRCLERGLGVATISPNQPRQRSSEESMRAGIQGAIDA